MLENRERTAHYEGWRQSMWKRPLHRAIKQSVFMYYNANVSPQWNKQGAAIGVMNAFCIKPTFSAKQRFHSTLSTARSCIMPRGKAHIANITHVIIYLILATEEDWGSIEISSRKCPQSLPHQKEQTCLAACLKLARRGTEQSHPSPASAPPASWLCSHTPAEPSRCSVV